MFKQLLLTAFTILCCNTALAGVITNSPLDTPEFWVNQLNRDDAVIMTRSTSCPGAASRAVTNGDSVIMTPIQIQVFNQKVYRTSPTTTFDLSALSAKVDSSIFKKNLTDYSAIAETVYKNGVKVDQAYKDQLIAQVNAAALPAQVEVRYAVVTKHCNMRILPTEDGLFDEPDDRYYDDLQDTTLEVGEPVAVFHTSKDGNFYFVEMHNYQGWIGKENLAFCSKAEWLKFLAPDKFLMVIDPSYNMKVKGQDLYYQMSARIPYQKITDNGYTVTVPTRTNKGQLKTLSVNIPKDKALYEGYLPYTQNNIIRQAFKYYGHVYGWGGLLCSVDCSGLSYDLFRTMGLYLPRNAGDQATTAGIGTDVNSFTREQRLEALSKLAPGSTIHLRRSHMMIYLGMVDGVPYVIHSSGSYYKDGKHIDTRRVIVSDLDLDKKIKGVFSTYLMLSNKYMTFKL